MAIVYDPRRTRGTERRPRPDRTYNIVSVEGPGLFLSAYAVLVAESRTPRVTLYGTSRLRLEIDGRIVVNRNFHFELHLHPKTCASYPVVSSANRSGLFEVVVRLILAVLRSRCAGFARPSLPRR